MHNNYSIHRTTRMDFQSMNSPSISTTQWSSRNASLITKAQCGSSFLPRILSNKSLHPHNKGHSKASYVPSFCPQVFLFPLIKETIHSCEHPKNLSLQNLNCQEIEKIPTSISIKSSTLLSQNTIISPAIPLASTAPHSKNLPTPRLLTNSVDIFWALTSCKHTMSTIEI